MTKIFRARAPLRLGLAGGGSDLSPFSEEYGGLVLNATVDLYAHSQLEPNSADEVHFKAQDIGIEIKFQSLSALPIHPILPLHCAIYNRLVSDFNHGQPLSFSLITFADAPPGSGLGTSSTMVVCILKVFSEWMGIRLGDYELAALAYTIERKDLGLAGGKQDQYASTFGGFNFIEFGKQEKVLVNSLRIKSWIRYELETCTVLFHTGKSRFSGEIIRHQVHEYSVGERRAVENTERLKLNAIAMKESLLRGSLTDFASLLNESWIIKRSLTSAVTNKEINDIYNVAMQNGAIAGKITGAGGGGVFIFYTTFALRCKLLDALRKLNGSILNFHFTLAGAESWSLDG